MNLYDYLNVSNTASKSEILSRYKKTMTIYENKSTYEDIDLYNIKILKIIKYILLNDENREKYNKLLIHESTPTKKINSDLRLPSITSRSRNEQ